MGPLKLPQKEEIHNAFEKGEGAVAGLFYTTFQKMAERIQQLDDRLAKKQRKQRETTLKGRIGKEA
jgi:hypothetical protein